jgi:hypothetical protein
VVQVFCGTFCLRSCVVAGNGNFDMKAKGCVVTVASHPWRGYKLFLKSCAQHNIKPIVLGMGKPYRSHIQKLLYLKEFLKEQAKDFTHLLFCDAYDVVLAASWPRIIQTFLSLNSPLVFSTERMCWPDIHLARDYPSSPMPYCFLNSGLWMGEISAASMLIKSILLQNVSAHNFSDQRLYADAFLNGKMPITLDYQCQLFQSLYQSPDDLRWDDKNHRIKNKLTKQFPLIFHGNGKSNMYFVLSRLGLLPSLKASFKMAAQNGLMSENQYRFVSHLIKSSDSGNFLVIGGGYDAELWYRRSRGNMTCVEDKPEWFPRLPCELIYPTYQGAIGKWLEKIETPKEIARPWDIVLVDGPEGHSPNTIGRQEPISWAARYATKIVLVHDYDRDWERQLCNYYLGKPARIIPFNGKNDCLLAVFDRSKLSKNC